MCLTFWLLPLGMSSGQGVEGANIAIDEARQLSKGLLKDSILIHNYNYLAEAFAHRDGEVTQRYIDTLNQLRQQSKWPKAEGLYYRALGKYHDRRGDFEEALDYYTRSIEALEEANDRSDYIAYTSILKAFVLNNNGLPDACEEELEKIRPIAEKLENKNYLAWIIDAFGDHYFYSGFKRQRRR